MSPLSLSLQGYNGQKGMFGEKGIPGISGPRVSPIAFEMMMMTINTIYIEIF